MPRKLRMEYPGAVYHVMSRGNRGADVFLDDVGRQDFLKTLAEACLKTGWQVHAYCLMRNHFHLVVETPQANLVAGMRWLLSAYTLRLNHRHQLFGHVFSGRYQAVIVDGGEGGYLRTVCDYVHLNPVRAKLIPTGERLLSYPWSSLGGYLAAREHRPQWLRVDRVLGAHGLTDTAAGRQAFERQLEARRKEETDPEALKVLRRGWCYGGEDFRRQLLAQMEDRLGGNHAGALRQETAEAKAERIVQAELARLKWNEKDLVRRPKGDPAKLALAARLRQETTLTVKHIAARVGLGTSKSANMRLHHWMKAVATPVDQPQHEQ